MSAVVPDSLPMDGLTYHIGLILQALLPRNEAKRQGLKESTLAIHSHQVRPSVASADRLRTLSHHGLVYCQSLMQQVPGLVVQRFRIRNRSLQRIWTTVDDRGPTLAYELKSRVL